MRAYRTSGLVGPLHGIPVMLKDQIDAAGMPTTLGSVLFRDYYPDQDAFVTTKLKEAGAIILAKVTLGEMAAGDTHGSLFGSTRNPYALDRTVGGSSGGPAAEHRRELRDAVGGAGGARVDSPAGGVEFDRRHAADRRPREPHAAFTRAGRKSRALSDPWREPSRISPRCSTCWSATTRTTRSRRTARRTSTAATNVFWMRPACAARASGSCASPIGIGSEPGSEDFAKVDAAFTRSIAELRAAGAVVVDPLVIPEPASAARQPRRPAGRQRRGVRELFRPKPQSAVRFDRGNARGARVRQADELREGAVQRQRRHCAALRAPRRARRAHAPLSESHDGSRLGCDRAEDERASADADRRRHEAAVREHEGRVVSQHVSGLRADRGSSGRIHRRQSAGRHHVHGQAVRRRRDAEARLRLRAGDAPPPPAEHDTGASR